VEKIERYDNAELMSRFIQQLSEDEEVLIANCWRDCRRDGGKIFHVYSKLNEEGKLVGQPSVRNSSVARLHDAVEKADVEKYLNDELLDYFAAIFMKRCVAFMLPTFSDSSFLHQRHTNVQASHPGKQKTILYFGHSLFEQIIL